MTEDLPLPPHGRAPMLENRMPCRWCGCPTLIATLNHYGARCLSCYEAFCQAPQPTPLMADRRSQGPFAWADALKARHESGERLTPAQVDAYRAVTGKRVAE